MSSSMKVTKHLLKMQTFDDSQLRQILLRRREAPKQRLGAFKLSTGRAAAVVTVTQPTQRGPL